jgi:hypothetical protein
LSYDPVDIFSLIKGEPNPEHKDTIRITDNCRLGEAPLSIVSFLVNHHLFNFSVEEMKQLSEHVLLQYERITQGKELNLQDIPWKRREEHDSEWAAASRLAWLYRLNFITWLNINRPEKAERLAKAIPINEPKPFIKTAVDKFTKLGTPHFEEVHTGLKYLANGS